MQLEWAAFTGQASLPSNNAKIVVTLPSGLPGGLAAGVVYLEVVQGSMVSQPKVCWALLQAGMLLSHAGCLPRVLIRQQVLQSCCSLSTAQAGSRGNICAWKALHLLCIGLP